MLVSMWLGLSLSAPSALCNTMNWSIQRQTFRLYPRASMMEPLRTGLTGAQGPCWAGPALHCPKESWLHPPLMGHCSQRAGPTPQGRAGHCTPVKWPHPLPQGKENWPQSHAHRGADSAPFPEASVPLEWSVQLTLRCTVGPWLTRPTSLPSKIFCSLWRKLVQWNNTCRISKTQSSQGISQRS